MPSSSESQTKPPIIVLSPARSGSTLLRYLLDTHPQIACPAEWAFARDILSSFAWFWVSHLDTVEDCDVDPAVVRARLKELGVPFTLDTLIEHYRGAHSAFYEAYAKNHHKKRWADTTHAVNDVYVDFVDLLYDRRPQYLLLHRHPFDTTLSHVDKFASTLSQAVEYWCEVTELHLDFSERIPDRCRHLRYEDLVRSPSTVMSEVFGFLGEDNPAGLIDRALRTTHAGKCGDHKILDERRIHQRSVGRWKQHPSAAVLRRDKRLMSLLRRLGYSDGPS